MFNCIWVLFLIYGNIRTCDALYSKCVLPAKGVVSDGDWYRYGDNHYLFSRNKSDFACARRQCAHSGGDVVSIHTDEENRFIISHLLNPSFIGLVSYGSGDKASYAWVDDSPYDFKHWSSATMKSESCAIMGDISKGYYWTTYHCTGSVHYICKIPIDKMNEGGASMRPADMPVSWVAVVAIVAVTLSVLAVVMSLLVVLHVRNQQTLMQQYQDLSIQLTESTQSQVVVTPVDVKLPAAVQRQGSIPEADYDYTDPRAIYTNPEPNSYNHHYSSLQPDVDSSGYLDITSRPAH